jgi:hypothetical protein
MSAGRHRDPTLVSSIRSTATTTRSRNLGWPKNLGRKLCSRRGFLERQTTTNAPGWASPCIQTATPTARLKQLHLDALSLGFPAFSVADQPHLQNSPHDRHARQGGGSLDKLGYVSHSLGNFCTSPAFCERGVSISARAAKKWSYTIRDA